jgi:glycogen phosphorylase
MEMTINHKNIPTRIEGILELAYNVWWSWNPAARDLFRLLDYPNWRNSGQNPVKMLFETSQDNLDGAAEDPEFLELYDRVIADFQRDMQSANLWFQQECASLVGPVAYFSMEFALHNSLPIYAGGLGILAGDMCKEASDLGIPLIGMGFMYPQGYFLQKISHEGWQLESYRQLDFREAPIKRIELCPGDRTITTLDLAGRKLALAVWRVQVGRVPIYLMDTDLPENNEDDRRLSARLYTPEAENRIQQEIILGIGGVRVLKALEIEPAVWHANEGHSAFMTLERIRLEVQKGLSFESARQKVKAATIFTTHTPVASGHDVFTADLMEKYFKNYWPELGLNKEQFLELGKPDIRGWDGFNMTALAINMSRHCNAVSRLHELETRQMWQNVWTGQSPQMIPVSHVTNGVHGPTWIADEWRGLFERYLSQDWEKWQDEVEFWKYIRNIPDEDIWEIHHNLKNRLIEVVKGRAQLRWTEGDVTGNQVITMGALLSPGILTIGFARRLTDYKRAAMIFQKPERLRAILTNWRYPVQLIFTGKAHPNDEGGKHILQRIYNAARDHRFQGRVAFVEDYDIHLAHYLTHGVDVWLNNPRRKQEASGTSGMKAAINGVLNLSVRDGWWEEAYNGLNGWAIGPGPEGASDPLQDKIDAESFYDLLESRIIPLYYQQDHNGVPHNWVKMIKESILSILPVFSTTRMVKEYARKLYSTAETPLPGNPANHSNISSET